MGELFAFLLGAAAALIAAGVSAFRRREHAPPVEVETLSLLEAELSARTSEEIEAIHKELAGDTSAHDLAARLNEL